MVRRVYQSKDLLMPGAAIQTDGPVLPDLQANLHVMQRHLPLFLHAMQASISLRGCNGRDLDTPLGVRRN
jgi:hypothetical protein